MTNPRHPDAEIQIAGRAIGAGRPVYVVAELSANHHGDYDEAARLVTAAAEAGADAVKLQTYSPDTMTLDCDAEPFRVKGGTLWDGATLYDLYRRAMTPWDWHPRLMQLAASLGLDCFSSPFDETAVDFLEKLDVPAHKVASFELVDLPLLERIGRTGRPVIASTGMASREEIREALDTLRAAGAREVALLQCTSAYPAPPEEMNLRTIPDLVQRFGVPVGLSDHTLGHDVAVAAVALGACIVEKHFTLSREVEGPDSAFSMEPDELRALVQAVRTTERALGEPRYAPSAREAASRAFRRSIFVVRDVAAGEVLTRENLRVIRPADGLAPKHLGEVLGRRARCDLERGMPLAWDLIE